MSYATYTQSKRRTGSGRASAERRTAAPGPSMDALRTGLAQPSAAQMGHRVDLPELMREKFETSFGTDLSGVKLYESQAVADAGAEAITRGSTVAFAPGMLDFTSRSGQALLGHELSHVVSQARGEATGSGFLNDRALEARADREGAMAAAGEPVYSSAMPTQALSAASAAPAAGPMQASKRSKEAAAKAAQGDYSDYANIDKKDRAPLLNAKKDVITADLNNGRDLMAKYGSSTTAMLNPVTRQAMSQMAKDKTLSGEHRQRLNDTMENMDQQMLIQTMLPANERQKENLKQHYKSGGDLKRLQREYREAPIMKPLFGTEKLSSGKVDTMLRERQQNPDNAQYEQQAQAQTENDLSRAQNSGDAMLRMMLLMQMGNFTKTTTTKDKRGKKHKQTEEWDKTMANAFAHGARTSFLFGETTRDGDNQTFDTNSVFNAIFAGNTEAAGVSRRSAATHRLVTPKAGRGMQGFKEEHGKMAAIKGATDSGYHNYGMDMAIGGAGNKGVTGSSGEGEVITNDGRSGHMYMGVRDSNATTRGGMLVGLETDSPYRMNQTGHMHTAAAKSEDNSSTGGMKDDITGDKYGGRTVDFNGATNEDLVTVLNSFTSHINNLRSGSEEQKAQYEALVKQLSGKRMSQEDMSALMTQLVGDGEQTKDLRERLARARTGGR